MGKAGAVNALVMDRRYGTVFEGLNGRTGTNVPTSTELNGQPATGIDSAGNKYQLTKDDLLHRQLQDHIAKMAGYPPGTDINTIKQAEFPHNDVPHRHGEVKALDALLKRREEIAAAEEKAAATREGRAPQNIETVTREGKQVEIVRIKSEAEFQKVLDDLYVDARFTFVKDPNDVASCCANCARIVSGPASLPDNVRDEADLTHGAKMGTGGFQAGSHLDPNDPDGSPNPKWERKEVYNPDYNEKFKEQDRKFKERQEQNQGSTN